MYLDNTDVILHVKLHLFMCCDCCITLLSLFNCMNTVSKLTKWITIIVVFVVYSMANAKLNVVLVTALMTYLSTAPDYV